MCGTCAADSSSSPTNELTCLYLLPLLARIPAALSGGATVGPPRPGQPHSGGRARLRRRPRRRHVSARRRRSAVGRRLSRSARLCRPAGASASRDARASEHQGSRRRAVRRASRVVALSRARGRDVPRSGASRCRCRSRCRPSTRSRSSLPPDTAWRCCRRSPSKASSRAESSCACTCRSWPSSARCAWSIARAASVSHAAAAFLSVAEAHAAKGRGRYAFTRE